MLGRLLKWSRNGHPALTASGYRSKMEAFDGLLRSALVATAAVSLPMLAVAALVGTSVAVVQAATQVQEQTLTLLPKILAVGAMAAAFGGVAMHLFAALFERATQAIPLLTGGS